MGRLAGIRCWSKMRPRILWGRSLAGLRLRGVTCLHASAVAFGRFAAAFVGGAGAGKSTTAAALARRGHAVVSDDIVALAERDGAFFVLPAYPYLCLWPDSVKLLYGSGDAPPAFSPSWDKRQLRLAENRLGFEEQRLLLGAVFLLGERSLEPAAPFIEDPAPKEALLALLETPTRPTSVDRETRKSEFELLGRRESTGFPYDDCGRTSYPFELVISATSSTKRASTYQNPFGSAPSVDAPRTRQNGTGDHPDTCAIRHI